MYIWPSVNIYMQKLLGDFLPPATKLGQGNIFRSVCQEFCPQEGGGVWADPPPSRYPREQCMLGDTGNKRAVRILLECILLRSNILWFYIWWFRETPDRAIHQAAGLTASWLWLVPFQWNGKMSIDREWETGSQNALQILFWLLASWWIVVFVLIGFPGKIFRTKMKNIWSGKYVSCAYPPSPNLPMQSVKSQCWQIQYFSRWEH